MKKTTQIHIGGRHFFIDEDAFQKLNHYLESLKRHFASDGETGSEVVEDIEQRIAELLEEKISTGKQAITLENVTETISVLGNVEDFVYTDSTGTPGPDAGRTDYAYGSRRENRKFYRDSDNYYIGGVSSGLGQYFDIDPLWIRLTFVLLFFAKGVGLLIYLILWLVVPKARTTAEKLQMRGRPVNLSTIKDAVNEEYEKVRAGSAYGPQDSTRNAVENLLRAMGLVVVAIFKFVLAAIGVIFLILGSVFLAGLIMAVLGFTNIFGHLHVWNGWYFPELGSYFANSGHYHAAIIALIVVILIPIIAIIYAGVKILFNIKGHHPVLRAFMLTSWILALILFITLVILNVSNSPIEASGSDSAELETGKYPYLVVDARDNIENRHVTHYRVMGLRFRYNEWDEALYDDAELRIALSNDDKVHLNILKRIKNIDMDNSWHYLDEVDYDWELRDSVVSLNRYFETDVDDFWMFPEVDLTLSIPEGQKIKLTKEACDMLVAADQNKYCSNAFAGKAWIMSPDGTLIAAD